MLSVCQDELWASPFFGIALSILAFLAGVRLQARLKSVLCNQQGQPACFQYVKIIDNIYACRNKEKGHICQQEIGLQTPYLTGQIIRLDGGWI